MGPAPKRPRVLRGGSWNNNSRNARCAYRNNNNNPNNRNNNIGFRVVLASWLSMASGRKCGAALCTKLRRRGLQKRVSRAVP
jgi:hypothetical protein